MAAAPTVTLVMPTYNEAAFVEACLESAVEDPRTDVLVVDGGSTDATRDIVTALMPRFPGLRLIHNPLRTAASAMNIGIAAARGEVVIRLDAHSVYPRGYVRRLTAALVEHGADVAGGAMVCQPRLGTAFGRAVAASLTNPWVMGNAGFRTGGQEVRTVDTVLFGCWNIDVLRRAGGYNEALDRSQDYDLSQRIRRLGGRMILVPDVVVEYQARSGVWENVRYAFWNGYWVGHPMAASGVRFAVRHLVPALACLSGVALLVVCWLLASPWPMLLAAPYLVILGLSAFAARTHGTAIALLQPPITLGTHVLYGLGTVYGITRGVFRARARMADRVKVGPAPPAASSTSPGHPSCHKRA